MKMKTETKYVADCPEGTEVSLVTAVGFVSMFNSLESLMNLEKAHEMVRDIS